MWLARRGAVAVAACPCARDRKKRERGALIVEQVFYFVKRERAMALNPAAALQAAQADLDRIHETFACTD